MTHDSPDLLTAEIKTCEFPDPHVIEKYIFLFVFFSVHLRS